MEVRVYEADSFFLFISFMLGLVMIDLIWKVNFLKISN